MDVAAAVDLLASIPEADATRVTAIGHSAGGHLALWTAARPGLPAGAPGSGPVVRVAAAVAQSGVVDLALGARLSLGGGVVTELLGGSPEEMPERYAAASPAELVPLGVPQLLVHGERDEIVPPRVSEAYAEAAARRRRPGRARADQRRGALRAPRAPLVLLARGSRLDRRVTLTRADAQRLDREDALAPFRERFVIADEERIYADGNSLGRLPRATAGALGELVETWGERLVSGWAEWIELPVAVGDQLAALVGAQAGEVLACDSTTVNLYKLAHAALDLRPGARAIVTDRENFPTDRYVLAGVAERRGLELRLIDCDAVAGPTPADVAAACSAGDVGLVSLSHVAYRSGALADLGAIEEAAAACGALVIWDLSHSVGAVPIDLPAAGAGLAVGCTYKYLNAGPGAPAFLYVAHELQERMRSPIQGWFGQRDQFEMGPAYVPAAGIERFAAGTPPILGLVAARAGVELVLEAGVEPIRRKSVALTELTAALADERLAAHGFTIASPRDPEARGGHVGVAHPEAWRLCRGLIEQAGVVPDFRAPDVVRLGFSPLYSRFVDVWDAVDRLERLVASGAYLSLPAERARVT